MVLPYVYEHQSISRKVPEIIAVGSPTINAYKIVFPTSALKIPTAAIAAGCGGTSPCTTDSPATSGIPIVISDTPVSNAIVNTNGINSTNPTWKIPESLLKMQRTSSPSELVSSQND